MLLSDALTYSLDEWFAIIAINLAGAFGALAVRRVGFLSTFGNISGNAATIALVRWCAALQFIVDGRMGEPTLLAMPRKDFPSLCRAWIIPRSASVR